MFLCTTAKGDRTTRFINATNAQRSTPIKWKSKQIPNTWCFLERLWIPDNFTCSTKCKIFFQRNMMCLTNVGLSLYAVQRHSKHRYCPQLFLKIATVVVMLVRSFKKGYLWRTYDVASNKYNVIKAWHPLYKLLSSFFHGKGSRRSLSDISSSHAPGSTKLPWRPCWKIDCCALLWLVLIREVILGPENLCDLSSLMMLQVQGPIGETHWFSSHKWESEKSNPGLPDLKNHAISLSHTDSTRKTLNQNVFNLNVCLWCLYTD